MTLSRRTIPDATTLQAFECVARHGSVTQAANELNLTQSAVSRQVKDLETQLGLLLFDRVRQRVVLSSDGQRLLPQVRKILQQTEEMMLRAMASAQSEHQLSIATLPTFGSRWLIPRLSDFAKRYPGKSLNIESRSSPFDFEEEDFDIAIHYGQPVWARATCHFLCSEWIVPVASPAMLDGIGDEDLRHLRHRPLLHLATRPKLWAEWSLANDIELDSPYRGNRFDQFAMIIEAAVAGLGYALVPRYLIEQELADGRLRIIIDRPMKTDNAYFLVLPEGRMKKPASLDFCNWMLGQVDDLDRAASGKFGLS